MRSIAHLLARCLRRGPVAPVLWALPPGVPTGEQAQGVAGATAPPRGGPAGATSDEADPDDLHRLMVDHSDAVFRLALSIVRDRALAEDVTQDTMVKAWLGLPTFRGDSSLKSWVMRIAHNTAISTLRARRAIVSDPDDMPEPVAPQEHSVARRVEGAVVVDAFVAALDDLDDLSRSVVVLRELEGLSYDEIVHVLNVPLPTVKTRLLRARRTLGAALREWQ